jgi:hypothetical protein
MVFNFYWFEKKAIYAFYAFAKYQTNNLMFLAAKLGIYGRLGGYLWLNFINPICCMFVPNIFK